MRAAGVPVVSVRSTGEYVLDETATQTDYDEADALVATHDPTDEAGQQRDLAFEIVGNWVREFNHLPPREMFYVIWARRIAVHGGDDPSGIVDEASAIAYIAGRDDWQALPQAARSFQSNQMKGLVDILAALAIVVSR